MTQSVRLSSTVDNAIGSPNTHAAGRAVLLLLQGVCDLCLLFAIVIVPLTMAGIREVGVAAFVACSLTMGLTWSVRQLLLRDSTSGFSGAEVIGLLSIGLVSLQLVELPSSLLSYLSPFSATGLSLWGSPEGTLFSSESWRQVSLTPSLTKSGLVLLLGYVVFFLTLTQRLRTFADVDFLIRVIACAAAVMAAVGLAQVCWGNGRFLWLFEHGSRNTNGSATGTFPNSNHFAHFLALGIGPLMWWWSCFRARRHRTSGSRVDAATRLRGHSRGLIHLLVGGAVVSALFAGVLSQSRGGIAAVSLAFALVLAGTFRQWKQMSRLVVPAVVVVVTGVIAFGTDALHREWTSIVSAGSVDEILAGRRPLWSAIVRALPSFWIAGSGLGSHAEVYPVWFTEQSRLRFSHAESGYLQVLLELGVPGLLLLLSGIGLCGRWCWTAWATNSSEIRGRVVAVGVGLAVSVLHSLVDFVWYLPGCMILTLALAACACRCSQLSKESPEHARTGRRRSSTPTILAGILLVAILPVGKLCAETTRPAVAASFAWHEYRKIAIPGSKSATHSHVTVIDGKLEPLIANLETVLHCDPSNSAAASQLAPLYLRRFELHMQNAPNRMTLQQIEDTVRHSEFATTTEIRNWLERAFGDAATDLFLASELTKRSLRGQPMRGESYLMLAQLGFLEGQTPTERSALVEQAVALRPNKATLLYSAGSIMADTGDMDAAFHYWRQAFRKKSLSQRELIEKLAPLLTAKEFNDRLAPDADDLWLLFREYEKLQRPDQQVAVAQLLQHQLTSEIPRSLQDEPQFWLQGYEIFTFTRQSAQAAACLKQALIADPGDYQTRRIVALLLVEQRRFDVAAEQLEWCLRRDPKDVEVQQVLEAVRSLTDTGS